MASSQMTGVPLRCRDESRDGTLGGPRAYIGFGPDDHRGYRGDFMFMKQLRDGKFHFAAYHWPEWPINRGA